MAGRVYEPVKASYWARNKKGVSEDQSSGGHSSLVDTVYAVIFYSRRSKLFARFVSFQCAGTRRDATVDTDRSLQMRVHGRSKERCAQPNGVFSGPDPGRLDRVNHEWCGWAAGACCNAHMMLGRDANTKIAPWRCSFLPVGSARKVSRQSWKRVGRRYLQSLSLRLSRACLLSHDS